MSDSNVQVMEESMLEVSTSDHSESNEHEHEDVVLVDDGSQSITSSVVIVEGDQQSTTPNIQNNPTPDIPFPSSASTFTSSSSTFSSSASNPTDPSSSSSNVIVTTSTQSTGTQEEEVEATIQTEGARNREEEIEDEEDEDEDEDEDDEEKIRNETILERLIALKDIVPVHRRRLIGDISRSIYGISKITGTFLGRAAWIISTTVLVVVIPLFMEVEKEQSLLAYETDQTLQQQAQQMLTPLQSK